jgi:sugar lactone lactonase YvrE
LPQAVAVDAAGNIYVADWFNNVVRQIRTNGNIVTFAGNGTKGYSGDGAGASGAQLSYPTALAFDKTGNLYIADSGNDVIRMVTLDGNIRTIAGNSTVGYSGDGGGAISAQLYNPSGVVVDAAGDVIIADTGNQVLREVVASTGNIETIGGNHYPGYSGDGGNIFYAQFNYPQGLAMDAAGNLYIADFGNSVIRKVTPYGAISTLAGNGTPGYSGNGGPAASSQLAYPQALAVDAQGDLYMADTGNQMIREITVSGTIVTIAGTGAPGYSGDGGPAVNADLYFPKGVAVSNSGAVYVADWDNDVIRMLTPFSTASDRDRRTEDR